MLKRYKTVWQKIRHLAYFSKTYIFFHVFFNFKWQ